ncbi:hypothetical protein [Iningainema tapete]|uniref:Uncharacterized protein n=1 Tax=Iningainema tapete BLCC-T55 TaxID=2748662 RepID=A0A8J6XF48_9CYAN|nr:hypothetical protein [Iningainema tapete]MBD2771507.1 hypothetical protein [Iningainema tapete BLCC-T55]
MATTEKNSLFTSLTVEESATVCGGSEISINVSNNSGNSISYNITDNTAQVTFEPKVVELVIRILNLPGNASLKRSLGLN